MVHLSGPTIRREANRSASEKLFPQRAPEHSEANFQQSQQSCLLPFLVQSASKSSVEMRLTQDCRKRTRLSERKIPSESAAQFPAVAMLRLCQPEWRKSWLSGFSALRTVSEPKKNQMGTTRHSIWPAAVVTSRVWTGHSGEFPCRQLSPILRQILPSGS